jgi:hypothetical protein
LIGAVPNSAPVAIAAGGSRVVAGSLQCFAGAESCQGVRETTGSPYAFTRTAGGWVASSLAPSAKQFPIQTWGKYNAEQGTALFSAPTPPTGQDDFYARQFDGSVVDIGPLSPPENGPGVTTAEDTFGTVSSETSDLSHIVFQQRPSPWSVGAAKNASVYEYVGTGNAAPTVVGVSGPLGSTSPISACSTEFGGTLNGLGHNPQGGLSADGRTAYFTASPDVVGCPASTPAPPVAELYARIDGGEPDAHTVSISEPQALAGGEPDEECKNTECQQDIERPANPGITNPNWRDGNFLAGSTDGSRVFFTSTERLTDAAGQDPSTIDTAFSQGCAKTTGANGCNLYLYDLNRPAGHRLLDLSAGDSSGGGPQVQGVLAISSDGSHVYFVAKGVLSAAANARGLSAQAGGENLYVSDGQDVTFIAQLPETAQEANTWLGSPGGSANVTPDGRFLVFTSRSPLTSDVTRTDGARQVYRYDSQTGELIRVSTGQAGFNDNGNGGFGDAFIVAGTSTSIQAGPMRTDPTMSDDGSFVFFESAIALTPHALNDVPIGEQEGQTRYAENVYEYHEGRVSLISDGHDTSVEGPEACTVPVRRSSATCLLGSDASGHNVFFTTADPLVPSDTDTQLDIYDARICEPEDGNPCIAQPPQPPPPCLGEACHGTPPATPPLLTPGSSTFNGAGNLTPLSPALVKPKPLTNAQKLVLALKACHKDHTRRKHMACERQVRRRYGPKSGRARKSTRRFR